MSFVDESAVLSRIRDVEYFNNVGLFQSDQTLEPLEPSEIVACNRDVSREKCRLAYIVGVFIVGVGGQGADPDAQGRLRRTCFHVRPSLLARSRTPLVDKQIGITADSQSRT